MDILIGCEQSGRVRDAFIAQGHNAVSCDILPSDAPGPHIQGDLRAVLSHRWDILIAFPPCTYLAASGARWWKDPDRIAEQEKALAFVRLLLDQPITRICIENPVGAISKAIRPPDQYIQPYEHGHPYTKKTGLWLKGLPLLKPSIISFDLRQPYVHTTARSPKIRSQTFHGIAKAMAIQWGGTQ